MFGNVAKQCLQCGSTTNRRQVRVEKETRDRYIHKACVDSKMLTCRLLILGTDGSNIYSGRSRVQKEKLRWHKLTEWHSSCLNASKRSENIWRQTVLGFKTQKNNSSILKLYSHLTEHIWGFLHDCTSR